MINFTRHATWWLGTKGEVERDYQSPPGPAGSTGLIGLIGEISSIGEIGIIDSGIIDGRIEGITDAIIDGSGEIGTMDAGVTGVIGKSEIGVIGMIGEIGELMFSSSVIGQISCGCDFRL